MQQHQAVTPSLSTDEYAIILGMFAGELQRKYEQQDYKSVKYLRDLYEKVRNIYLDNLRSKRNSLS